MLKLAGLVLVPTALVMKQPDLGTSLTYVAVLIACAFLAGLRWKYIAIIAVVAVVVIPITLAVFEGLPEGPDREFHEPRARSAGKGLSIDPVPDRDRVGWDVRQGCYQGNSNPVAVLCRCPTRTLSFRHLPRSTGSWGSRSFVVVVFCAADAHRPECADGARSGGDVHLHGGGGSAAVPHSGECGDGGRTDAGNRNSAALYEFWRFEYLDVFLGIGVGE